MKIFSTQARTKSKSIITQQKKFLQGLVFLICFSLFIVFIFGDHGLLKLYKIKQKRKKIQANITQLRNEKETVCCGNSPADIVTPEEIKTASPV